MRWVQSEYALKGLFLGLLFYTALQIQVAPPPDGMTRTLEEESREAWAITGRIALYILTGLGAGLLLAMFRQLRYFGRILKKVHAFFVFLLLENPFLIYVGLVGGLGFGAISEFKSTAGGPNIVLLSLGGAILGFGYSQLRDIKDLRFRLGISVLAGAGVVYAIIMWLQEFNEGKFLADHAKAQMLGIDILLGLPFYYLLCFVGIAEESEGEIAGLCTMLGLSLYLIFPSLPAAVTSLIPIAIYYTYVMYVLKGLRVFKHTLRGYTYMEIGKLRPALLSFRRALQLDPGNGFAQMGMDALHSNIEIERADAETLGLLDPNRCLAIVRRLLLQAPTPDQMRKAAHLLNLIEKIWPKQTSQVLYYRTILAVHSREMDRACDMLGDLLTPEGWFAGDAARKSILFDAWQLALLVHPVLKQRVGDPQLVQPGRRLEAIGAVERQIVERPDEPGLLEFRALLFEGLSENEYVEAAKNGPAVDFPHRYAEERGLALIGDSEKWRRGAEYLRMAATGLPLRRPSILQRLAEAYAKAGETHEAARYLKLVRDSGAEIGPTNLPEDQRAIFFSTVKKLADEAAAQLDFDEAIYDYSLYTKFPGSGKETVRHLAKMYEGKKEIFEALRLTEKGLVYDKADKDFLEKKDTYYYSLDPAVLEKVNRDDDRVRKYFDVDYCVKKAKGLLDGRNTDLENLDWADHLVKLALVMQPKNMMALVQQSRILLRRGDRDEGLRILEDIRELKPSGSEESDAWYFTHKQLGKLYLDELNRADLAIPCFLEYLNHVASGADTSFDLGRAYEAKGEIANAIKYYRMVTAYEQHPLRWDAEQAIRRLKEAVT